MTKSKKKTLWIFTPFMALLAVLMAVVIAVCCAFQNTLCMYFGKSESKVSDETLAAAAGLTEEIVGEGSVLLKNGGEGEDAPLPLTAGEMSKINVFGWAAYDWMTSAFGSGFSNTALEKIKLFPALQEAGIQYNTELYDLYRNFYSHPVDQWGLHLDEYRGDVEVGSEQKFVLHEPGETFYTDSVIANASAFSSVALVVIGRTGGEAADLRMYQTKQEQKNGSDKTVRDDTRTYLQISTEEEQMIKAAKRACNKVIVLLNTSNTMELGFINDPEFGVDAAILVGLTGYTGVRSVIDLLRGQDENGNLVSPSGRTADTYAYHINSAPSSVNSGYGGAVKYSGLSTSGDYVKGYYDAYVDYYEGIYVGYKWYETADAEHYWDDKGGYDAIVQYPFGYGLSYTVFTQEIIKDAEVYEEKGAENPFFLAETLEKGKEYSVIVRVTNTGATPARDVVQLYYTPPYNGTTEVSEVNLLAFAKTDVIVPETFSSGGAPYEDVVLTFTAYDMATYDVTAQDGAGGYVLFDGDYTVSLRQNAHTPFDGQSVTVSTNGGLVYSEDPETGNPVCNRFTGSDTIDGYPIDGSAETQPVQYLSRSDFAQTFPTQKNLRARSELGGAVATAIKPTEEQLRRTGDYVDTMPETGASKTRTLDEMIDANGIDDARWEELVRQVTKTEIVKLFRDGFFKTAAIESIDKPMYWDYDGPLGLNTRVTSSTSCKFVPYPSETLVAQTWNVSLAYRLGKSVGTEARESELGIRGWYGPGANIHRNPYGGRNAEYYSEDGVLSGKFTAETVRGAKEMGIHCYIKHFVANDSESLREGLFTFLTEQSLREIYLKPYEIAVKEGGANGLMTSMNRLGAVWSGGSHALCTEVLREEWGFEGALITDWVDSGSTYMTDYRGIWAGNDLWLHNTEYAPSAFVDDSYLNDPSFMTLAQERVRDILWMLVDTAQTYASAHPDADVTHYFSQGGASMSYDWVWYLPVPVCAALLIGEGILTFFLVKKLRKKEEE